MHSNVEMVNYLVTTGWIRSERVKKAFLAVDRKLFMPKGAEGSAYYDCPLPIGHGQTISAPSVVAFMLEQLEVPEGAKILELGTGSGYNAALLSRLVGPEGIIISFDVVPELIDFAQENIEKVKELVARLDTATPAISHGQADRIRSGGARRRGAHVDPARVLGRGGQFPAGGRGLRGPRQGPDRGPRVQGRGLPLRRAAAVPATRGCECRLPSAAQLAAL